MEIKKLATLTFAIMMGMSAMAQESYIVKTKSAKKSATVKQTETNTGVEAEEEEATATDFVSQNFKYQSLCNW